MTDCYCRCWKDNRINQTEISEKKSLVLAMHTSPALKDHYIIICLYRLLWVASKLTPICATVLVSSDLFLSFFLSFCGGEVSSKLVRFLSSSVLWVTVNPQSQTKAWNLQCFVKQQRPLRVKVNRWKWKILYLNISCPHGGLNPPKKSQSTVTIWMPWTHNQRWFYCTFSLFFIEINVLLELEKKETLYKNVHNTINFKLAIPHNGKKRKYTYSVLKWGGI